MKAAIAHIAFEAIETSAAAVDRALAPFEPATTACARCRYRPPDRATYATTKVAHGRVIQLKRRRRVNHGKHTAFGGVDLGG